jgi:hypothetical protein
MNPTSVQNDWKNLYKAALFEPNKDKIPVRIADAEQRIATRARELFNSGDHNTLERSALNVALYALLPSGAPLNGTSAIDALSPRWLQELFSSVCVQ